MDSKWLFLLIGTLAAMVEPTAAQEPLFPQQPAAAGEDAARRAQVPAPHRTREEIQQDIRALEARRADLLTRYAPAHPDVRAVERRLSILRAQLEMLPPPRH
ncbi:hypothetical protein [Thiobacter aerophilum]|uniref:YbgF trimerisation domain-containing protein n=1 Tax=Thiobacter aerophilum TaxID=3121275 RepID=A0ABV0EE43_9BURK